jgi:hypothetical protein
VTVAVDRRRVGHGASPLCPRLTARVRLTCRR